MAANSLAITEPSPLGRENWQPVMMWIYLVVSNQNAQLQDSLSVTSQEAAMTRWWDLFIIDFFPPWVDWRLGWVSRQTDRP